MTCPSCGSTCVAMYTHSQTIGKRRIEWTECAACFKSTTPASADTNVSMLRQSPTVSPVRVDRKILAEQARREQGMFDLEVDA